jgi:ABC-type spermidine/putrescine transport system permease subunit I
MASTADTPLRPSVPARPGGRSGRERLAGSLGRLSQYAGFSPAVVLFGAFFLAPMALIVAYSFWKVVDYNVVHQWTLDNYRYFFSVPTYVTTLVSTLWMAAAATLLTLLAAFPFAYWLVRHVRPRWQRPLLLLVIVPFWTSYLLRVASWTTILGEKGVINRTLQALGLIDHPLSFLLYNRPAVILVLVYLYFPFAALTLYSTLERFDWSQLRAAMDLGAPPLTAIRRVMLPQVRPGITTSVIFVFIPVIGEYLTPQLVGGTRGVMIGNLIVNFFTGAQYTRGAAVALLIAALIVALLIVFRRSLEVGEAYGR